MKNIFKSFSYSLCSRDCILDTQQKPGCFISQPLEDFQMFCQINLFQIQSNIYNKLNISNTCTHD